MKFRSLATAAAADGDPTFSDILDAQGDGTDRNWYDFDILAAGVSAAGLDGALDAQDEVTVFLPNDRAFQALVTDLFGWRHWFANEAKTPTTGTRSSSAASSTSPLRTASVTASAGCCIRSTTCPVGRGPLAHWS